MAGPVVLSCLQRALGELLPHFSRLRRPCPGTWHTQLTTALVAPSTIVTSGLQWPHGIMPVLALQGARPAVEGLTAADELRTGGRWWTAAHFCKTKCSLGAGVDKAATPLNNGRDGK